MKIELQYSHDQKTNIDFSGNRVDVRETYDVRRDVEQATKKSPEVIERYVTLDRDGVSFVNHVT